MKVALKNIAELPEGFLKITHELSDKTDLLDEVFGVSSIKALHNLLPKITDYVATMPPAEGAEPYQEKETFIPPEPFWSFPTEI